MADDFDEYLVEKPPTIPEKSKKSYECAYNKFMKWVQEQNIDNYTEDVLLKYFIDLSKTMKITTLWAYYSMLKSELHIRHNVQIEKYRKLFAFLKKSTQGYKPKPMKKFTKQQLLDFFHNAPDRRYLLIKVILMFRVFGQCTTDELVWMRITDVEDLEKLLFVKIQKNQTNSPRSFTINGEFYLNLYRKYISLRLEDNHTDRLFVKYKDGKCRRTVIGRNKFPSLYRDVATYLKLPSSSDYIGFTFRKSYKDFLGDERSIRRRQNFQNSSIDNESETVIIRDGVEIDEEQSEIITIKTEIEDDEEEMSSVMSDDMDTNMSLDNVDEIVDKVTVNNEIKVEKCSEDEEQLETDKNSDANTINVRKDETIDTTVHGINFKLNYCSNCTFNIKITNKND